MKILMSQKLLQEWWPCRYLLYLSSLRTLLKLLSAAGNRCPCQFFTHFIHWPQRLHLPEHSNSLCDSDGKQGHEFAGSLFPVYRWLQSFLPWVTCATWGEMWPCRYLAGVTNPGQINSSHRLLGFPFADLEATIRMKSMASPPSLAQQRQVPCRVPAHAREVGKLPL